VKNKNLVDQYIKDETKPTNLGDEKKLCFIKIACVNLAFCYINSI